MNSQQVQDIRLMYEAVYDDELREKAEEYNSMIRDEDILEVATEYFYTYGLNSTGVDILIEKVGLDNFVEFIYDLSEDLVLTEAKKSKAKKQPSLLASQRAKLAAQKAAKERTETERKEPESKGPDTEAKEEQPKSKKPERGGVRGAIERGMERHRLATTVASNVAKKAGPAFGKGLMHGVGGTLGLIGKIASGGLKEEFEYWVNSLVEEGYDLSDYTCDNFDIIFEYLVAEGYADTNEAALTIMANMSEEWRQNILLELTPLGIKTAGAVDDQRRGSTRDKDLKDTADTLKKMRPYPNGFPAVRGV